MLICLDTNVYSRPFDDQSQPQIEQEAERTTQFVMLLERGKGDSVEEIIDFWGNSAIDDIYERINAWKAEEDSLEE